MFKLTFRTMYLAVALAGGSTLTLGCADAPATESVERTGTLTAALTTVGSDGATYAFQLGTYLTVSSASYGESLPLDGSETLLEKKLPVGSYTAGFAYSTAGLVLSRTEGMVTTNVNAQWSDMQPVTFDIVDGQVTPIVLHLRVQGLSDLTFTMGKLQVSAEVTEESVAQASHMVAEGSVNFYQQEFADPSSAYASALGVDLGVDLAPYRVAFQATSDWTQLGNATVCKYGNVVETSGAGNPGLANRLGQLYGGSGFVCIYDQGTTDWMTFSASLTGAPPFGQEMLFPNPPYTFAVNGGGSVPDLYDGQTLLQSTLETPTAISGGYLGHYIYDSASVLLTQAWGSSTATIQVMP